MRLITIARISKDGVTGESVTAGEVGEAYDEEKLARRVIKQFRDAKQELTAGITARRVVESQQQLLFAEF